MREIHIVIEAAFLRDARVSWGAAQYIYYAVHNPKEMPADPTEGQAVHAADPAVAEKIRDIRRRVKVAHDTAKARGQHGH